MEESEGCKLGAGKSRKGRKEEKDVEEVEKHVKEEQNWKKDAKEK